MIWLWFFRLIVCFRFFFRFCGFLVSFAFAFFVCLYSWFVGYEAHSSMQTTMMPHIKNYCDLTWFLIISFSLGVCNTKSVHASRNDTTKKHDSNWFTQRIQFVMPMANDSYSIRQRKNFFHYIFLLPHGIWLIPMFNRCENWNTTCVPSGECAFDDKWTKHRTKRKL